MSFREQLRRLRKKQGLKVVELAKKSGVSPSYLSMLENGLLKNDPTEETIRKIEQGLGVEEGELSNYATTGSTTAIKVINAIPADAEKMNKILAEIAKDKTWLDKLLNEMKK